MPANVQAPFQGVGTILLSDVGNLSIAGSIMSPMRIAEAMRKYLDYTIAGIERNGGLVEMFVGTAVCAYWRSSGDSDEHAQRAFDTACQLIESLPRLGQELNEQRRLTFDLGIVLGTGEMAGALFGPTNQFQVVGKAKAIADRLSIQPGAKGCYISMSQYTAALLADKTGLSQAGTIPRNGLPDLEILTYDPAKARLKRLILLGKERGYITHREITEHLPDVIDQEQIEFFVTTFSDMNIEVRSAD